MFPDRQFTIEAGQDDNNTGSRHPVRAAAQTSKIFADSHLNPQRGRSGLRIDGVDCNPVAAQRGVDDLDGGKACRIAKSALL